ncbi:MAG: hypothetical protein OQK82_03495 [Candidatus Pacearchaeota archaeon]|nr:hypothetical protein [Candidatus Pacearchaeota archaeon]
MDRRDELLEQAKLKSTIFYELFEMVWYALDNLNSRLGEIENGKNINS